MVLGNCFTYFWGPGRAIHRLASFAKGFSTRFHACKEFGLQLFCSIAWHLDAGDLQSDARKDNAGSEP